MKAKSSESFSAFLDGEASEMDVQRMLKALDDQPELFQNWHSLSKVHAELQGDTVVEVGVAFDSQLDGAAQKTSSRKFPKKIWQGGIAAAVAVVVVTSANMLTIEQPEIVVSSQSNSPEISAQIAQSQFEAQQRLDLYLREHAEQASYTTGHVVAPSELKWIEVESE